MGHCISTLGSFRVSHLDADNLHLPLINISFEHPLKVLPHFSTTQLLFRCNFPVVLKRHFKTMQLWYPSPKLPPRHLLMIFTWTNLSYEYGHKMKSFLLQHILHIYRSSLSWNASNLSHFFNLQIVNVDPWVPIFSQSFIGHFFLSYLPFKLSIFGE